MTAWKQCQGAASGGFLVSARPNLWLYVWTAGRRWNSLEPCENRSYLKSTFDKTDSGLSVVYLV